MTLATLRRVGMPIRLMRSIPQQGVGGAAHLGELRATADALAHRIHSVEHHLEAGVPVETSRIAQVTIVTDDLDRSIAFYRDAFDAAYHREISSATTSTCSRTDGQCRVGR